MPKKRTTSIDEQAAPSLFSEAKPVAARYRPPVKPILTAAERVELAGLLAWLRTAELPAAPFALVVSQKPWLGPAIIVTDSKRFRAWLLENGAAEGQVAIGIFETLKRLKELQT